MRVLVDTTPLRRSRDFRRIFMGQSVSVFGSAVTTAALPFQVFHLTRSSVAVGLLGLCQLGPLLVFAVVGGSFADTHDKRRLILRGTSLLMCGSIALTLNALLAHPQVWVLFVVGALMSGVSAANASVNRSLIPLLLDDSERPAGFALMATYGSLAAMFGPAAGGVLIQAFGVKTAYALDAVTFLWGLSFVRTIAAAPPVGGADASTRRGSIVEGLRFLRGQSVIMSIFGIDLLAMIFGMPRALLPALVERLHGGPRLYGLLYGAIAAGMFLASVTSGWTGRIHRQGRAVLCAVAAWGVSVAGVGLTTSVPLVLVMFMLAGAADAVSAVFRSTIAAAVTPDAFRGRVSGVEFAVYAGGPTLGDVEAGVVGGLAGIPFAIVSGGLLCVASAIVFAFAVPSFAGYRRPLATDPPASARIE